jgi:hypothetical protein
MPRVGYIPSLNLSFAMAFNSYMGMNTTMGNLENKGTNMYGQTFCTAMTMAVNALAPGMFDFKPC